MCIQMLYDFKQKYGNNYNLTIVGDGPEIEILKDSVTNYGLKNQIRFLGFLQSKDIVDELNAHRFLLVPSRWEEPFGIVVLEGLACGCIPIVSDGGGLPDAVGKAGVVFKRNSQESMNMETIRLIENKKIQENYLKEAKIHLQNHTDDVVCEKYFEVILNAYKA